MDRKHNKRDLKIVQVINYILSQEPASTCNKMDLLKLIFLADRYHLRMYGESITHDTYFAMKMGPVASNAELIIDGYHENDEAQGCFHQSCRSLADYCVELIKPVDDLLSDLEKHTLSAVCHLPNRGASLVEYTHQFPEWKDVYSTQRSRSKMKWDHFFGKLDSNVSDYCPADDSRVRESHMVYEKKKPKTTLQFTSKDCENIQRMIESPPAPNEELIKLMALL